MPQLQEFVGWLCFLVYNSRFQVSLFFFSCIIRNIACESFLNLSNRGKEFNLDSGAQIQACQEFRRKRWQKVDIFPGFPSPHCQVQPARLEKPL
jgi:hypothetical protein